MPTTVPSSPAVMNTSPRASTHKYDRQMKLSDGVGGREFAGVVNMQACRQKVKIGDKI